MQSVDLPASGRTGPDAGEVPFRFNELFFSRTDLRGKIQAGNSVFQRVSQYSWAEMLNKPHNIVRDPEMPRGLFYYLWDKLRRSEPMGGYVKNRAKDGRYYWVFAIVTPIADGYMSVRLKPSSPLLDLVKQEYARAYREERNSGISPAESCALLMKRVEELGFRNYETFMAMALGQEMSARASALGLPPDPVVSAFLSLVTSSQSLLDAATTIFEGYNSHRFVPLNLQVQAGRLGEVGAAIGMISTNYSILSDEIRNGMGTFIGAAHDAATTIAEGAFLLGTAMIQQEIIDIFRKEDQTDTQVDHTREMRILQEQRDTYHHKAVSNLQAIQRDIERFHTETQQMKRLASGLAAIRLMGKVESGRLSVGVLNDLIADLQVFQAVILKGLTDIVAVNHALRQNASNLLAAYMAA